MEEKNTEVFWHACNANNRSSAQASNFIPLLQCQRMTKSTRRLGAPSENLWSWSTLRTMSQDRREGSVSQHDCRTMKPASDISFFPQLKSCEERNGQLWRREKWTVEKREMGSCWEERNVHLWREKWAVVKREIDSCGEEGMGSCEERNGQLWRREKLTVVGKRERDSFVEKRKMYSWKKCAIERRETSLLALRMPSFVRWAGVSNCGDQGRRMLFFGGGGSYCPLLTVPFSCRWHKANQQQPSVPRLLKPPWNWTWRQRHELAGYVLHDLTLKLLYHPC